MKIPVDVLLELEDLITKHQTDRKLIQRAKIGVRSQVEIDAERMVSLGYGDPWRSIVIGLLAVIADLRKQNQKEND